MTSRDFVYFLQGFFEINSAKQGGYEITDEQIEDILIDVSDIDDDKYHWVESELKKLKQ